MNTWPVVKLSDVATLSSGGTPSKSKPSFWDGDIPWVSPKDMKCNHVIDAEDKITRSAVAESAARIVGSNSVLAVVRSGILAHTFPVATLGGEVSFNQDIKAITPKGGFLLPAFLFWMLKGQEAQILRIGVKKGATVHSLSSGFLESLQFPLPPLDQQQRIVGLLDRATEIRRRADAARVHARAIIPALFLETFGDPATNPKGWPETFLSEVLATTLSYGSMTSPRASEDDWLDIRVANIKVNQIDHSDKKYVVLEPSLVAKHSLIDGDIVLARAIGSESHLGKCAVVYPGKQRWAYDSHIMRIRVNQKQVLPEWLHTLMTTDAGKARLLRQKRASAIQHNINTKEVAIFRFPLPPLPLQTAFAEQASRLEAVARQLDAAAAKAEAMANALSGEVFG